MTDFQAIERRDKVSAIQGVAPLFLTDLAKTKQEDKRIKTAEELLKYVKTELKHESPEFVQEFMSIMDNTKNDQHQSAVYECIYSTDLDEKKGGILLIVCLSEVPTCGTRVVGYAKFLLKVLTVQPMDESGMELAARALAYLIQTAKPLAGEFVEKCLDHCMEWLQETSRTEQRRMAAVLLARELAMFASTAFVLRANVFFKHIFTVIRDPKASIRVAAVNALHATLTVLSQREAKQKTEFYNDCFKEAVATLTLSDAKLSNKEDKYHSTLLVFNELLRIADASFERTRTAALGIDTTPASLDNPIQWLTVKRNLQIVESKTAVRVVAHNWNTIVIEALNASTTFRGPSNVHSVLLELFPRLIAFGKKDVIKIAENSKEEEEYIVRLPKEKCDKMFAHARNQSRVLKNPSALISIGLMMLQDPHHFEHFGPEAFMSVNEFFSTASHKKRAPESAVFIFLTLYVRAYGSHSKRDRDEKNPRPVVSQIRKLLPVMFKAGLSKGLTNVLHEVMRSVEELKLDVQDGLMKELFVMLTGSQLPNKIDPPMKPLVPQSITQVSNVEVTVLALETLGSFEFQRHSLRMFMQYIADGYLLCDSVSVRLAAVKCCTQMLVPFVKVFDTAHRDHRQWILKLIHNILQSLVSVGVVDPQVEVRLCVMECFFRADTAFLSHLAQPEVLEQMFMSLHDEKLEMQDAAVCLLGRLAELNPALVLPRMRRVLLETISQLTNSGQARLEEHSARILTRMSRQNPKFMRPYLGALLNALLPKLRSEIRHADVTVQVLHAISELSVVGGSELVKNIDHLFSKLTQLINDSSSLQRREAAIVCIARICRSTAYVVDPYKDYPTLLDDLMRLLKTEMSASIRKEVMRVLGVLGALDPFALKVFTGAVQSANSISTALSCPISRSESLDKDPRQGASELRNEIIQWVNYEKCTLEEFYPAITIANLLVMVQDEAYSDHYQSITTALVTTFRSIGESYPQYVSQVVPHFIKVVKTSQGKKEYREFFLMQMARLVAIIKGHAKPFMRDIFEIIANAWKEDYSMKVTVVSVLEMMGTHLGSEFAPYVSELIPYLLQVVQTDKSDDRKVTRQVLKCVSSLSGCLAPHMHLVLPPVLATVDDSRSPISVRKQALGTVLFLARADDVIDYAPRLMQTWQRCIETVELQTDLKELLLEIVKQMWKHFEIFKRSVDANLRKYNLCQGEFYTKYLMLTKEAQNSLSIHQIKTGLGTGPDPEADKKASQRSDEARAQTIGRHEGTSHTVNKQTVNLQVLARSWVVDGLGSREEWSQWLTNFRATCMKAGSSAAIRAAAPIADVHRTLAKDLFNAAFMSVWTELTSDDQNALTQCLSKALDSDHPEVTQMILNLAEFMDHSEKGPLPISCIRLGKSAEDAKAYAKALRYAEIAINLRLDNAKDEKLTTDDCQALITFANKLNVQEEAAGVVRYAELHGLEREIKTQGRWYEKLNEWEKALQHYQTDESMGEDTTAQQMRCLEALGRWRDLNQKTKTMHSMEPKMLVTAARGAWAIEDWPRMTELVSNLNENSQDGAFLRAVIAVRNSDYQLATEYIDRVRSLYDGELTSMASESYERAYGAMILVQQLAELEEAIEYKLRPERRPRIALLWSRRLQGCRQNIEQWQRLLMLRSVVLNEQEMHPLRVKFASLCRQQKKDSMCEAVLRELLNLNPEARLVEAQAPNDKPQLVLALCKQLWKEEETKVVATTTLEALCKQLDRQPHDSDSQEGLRLCAKAYLKLGEWTEHQIKQETRDSRPNAVFPVSPKASMVAMEDEKKIVEYQQIVSAQQSMEPVYKPHAPFSCWNNVEKTRTKFMLHYYTKSTEYDPHWHKAWHKLAAAYLMAQNMERDNWNKHAPMMRSPKPAQAKTSNGTNHGMSVAAANTQPLTGTAVMGASMGPLAPNQARMVPGQMGAPQQLPGVMGPQFAGPLQLPAPLQNMPWTTVAGPVGVMGGMGAPGNIPPGNLLPGNLPPGNMGAGYMAPGNVPPGFVPPPALSPDIFDSHNQSSSESASTANKVPLNVDLACKAVHCFVKTLTLTPGSRLEDTLRFLNLCFDYGENSEVFNILRDSIKGLPIQAWLEVVPQLMARLDSKEKMASLVKIVIHEIAKSNPQALVYQLTVASRSQSAVRAANAKALLAQMEELHPVLVDNARLVSDELVRCAILWHEQWNDALDDASRFYFQEKNLRGMMEVLKPLHDLIETNPTTLKEQSFKQTYYCDLQDAYKFTQAYERSKNQKELTQAWEIYCQVFKRIATQLRQLTSLDLNYISPLLMKAKDLQLAVPGTYDPKSEIVGIAAIGTHLQVISSKQRPRKMTIRGSNGLEYQFLLKGHEDPRQDERVMQLFGLVNTLLVNNAETSRRNLTIQRYSIIALSQNSGLIGWLPDCDTLHSLIRDYREKKRQSLSMEHKLMQTFAPDTEQLTLLQKLQVYQKALQSNPGIDLRHILWLKSPSSEVWFDRRTNYTRSIACMSMVGYVLGLGDRHPSNLMLDRLTGKVIHIDFGDCFDVAMTREKFPERIPFRLTRMLIKAMEATGIEGNFRFTCECVLNLLRNNRESLLAVLEAFVYDPVINWRLVYGETRDPLKGDYPKNQPQQEAPRQMSAYVMERIRDKLTGRVGTEVFGVDEQIGKLIEQATTHENLCQAYIGWCPFW